MFCNWNHIEGCDTSIALRTDTRLWRRYQGDSCPIKAPTIYNPVGLHSQPAITKRLKFHRCCYPARRTMSNQLGRLWIWFHKQRCRFRPPVPVEQERLPSIFPELITAHLPCIAFYKCSTSGSGVELPLSRVYSTFTPLSITLDCR